jgi:membrane protease YdiL (CAAX protease family)
MIVARMIGAILVYLAVLALLSGALYAVGLFLVPTAIDGPFALVGLAIAEGGAFISVLVLGRVVDKRPPLSYGLVRKHAGRRWLRGAGVATLMMGFIVLGWFTLINGADWSLNDDLQRAMLALIAGLIGFGVQGPAEEMLFRGYMMENMRGRWGLGWAIAISSMAFGLIHAANTSFGLLPLLNLVLFGLAMGLYRLYVDAGQLWGVFAIHGIWNWLQQVVFGLPNSGMTSTVDNTLFHVEPNTAMPYPFWGGGFGPEGTLGATLVLLALIVYCLRRRPRVPIGL